MKTLLQINTVGNWGSTGRIAEEIGLLAIKSGWQSYIAFGRNERPSQSRLIKIGSALDILKHVLYTRLSDKHGFASENSTAELITNIEGIKPDVILLHNLHGYYLNVKILFDYLSFSGIPLIWTMHDCWPITGHCVYFEFINCDRWKSGCYECPQKKSYPSSILFDNSKTNYILKKEIFTSVKRMIIVPVSQWLENILKESYLNGYNIKTVHNGINLDTFSPQTDGNRIRSEYGIGDSFMVLGVASVWSDRKGLNDFKKLFQHLPKDCIIVLIGLNKKQIKGLPSGIIGLSITDNIKELTSIYSAADVYVNPTWEDNFPTTNLEAMACGTPVITYRSGGSIEALTTETGFIIEKGDIYGLLNAIIAVKGKGKAGYSVACRERAIERFDKDECFKEYIELINKV